MIDIDLLKGIPPGKIILKEIAKLKLSQREFARKIGIHTQTLNAIIKGHRKLTTKMALEIEEFLHFPEGSLLILQAFHSIKEYKKSTASIKLVYPPKIREVLFWDTDFKKIDWTGQKGAVIKRVKERGNLEEKREIAKFYNIPFNNL